MTNLRSDLDRVDFSDIEDTSVPPVGPIHPGEILRDEFLEPMGITPDHAAMDLAMPADQLTAILAGDRPITADTALRLARCFGTSAEFWINLQAQYDLELATRTYGDEIVRQVRPRNAADAERYFAARGSRTTPARAKALLTGLGTAGAIQDDDRLDAVDNTEPTK